VKGGNSYENQLKGESENLEKVEHRLMEINMEMSCLQVLAIKATHEAYKMQMILSKFAPVQMPLTDARGHFPAKCVNFTKEKISQNAGPKELKSTVKILCAQDVYSM